MAFWDVDLDSRVGAQGATHLGSIGAFAFAVLALLSAFVLGGISGFDTAEGIGIAVSATVEAIIAAIAGFRFREGKGAFWGLGLLAILLIEGLFKLLTLSIGGLVINVVLLVCVLQGVRGAFALRNSAGFPEDDAGVFD